MASPAETLLNAAMTSLLAVSGDTLEFRAVNITALVDRTQTWNQPMPATFVEVLQDDLSSKPLPGERFTASVTGEDDIYYTVLYVKPIGGRWRCECYVLADSNTETVVIGATTYSCHAFSSTEGTDLELGGLTRQNLIRVALDRFDVNNNTMPAEGQAVTFRGISTYRVTRVQRDQPGAPVILDIADEAGGGGR